MGGYLITRQTLANGVRKQMRLLEVFVVRRCLRGGRIPYHVPVGDDLERGRLSAGIFVAKGEESNGFKRILCGHQWRL